MHSVAGAHEVMQHGHRPARRYLVNGSVIRAGAPAIGGSVKVSVAAQGNAAKWRASSIQKSAGQKIVDNVVRSREGHAVDGALLMHPSILGVVVQQAIAPLCKRPKFGVQGVEIAVE